MKVGGAGDENRNRTNDATQGALLRALLGGSCWALDDDSSLVLAIMAGNGWAMMAGGGELLFGVACSAIGFEI